jgi:ribonuclease Z
MSMPLLPRRNVLGLLFGATVAKAVAPGLAQPAAAASSAGVAPLTQVDLHADGMQLVITGSGSALPDPLRGGASCAVVIDGVVLQFDCGRRVLENLMLVGINPMRIDHLFFSHLHFDHIADYDYFAITDWIAGRQEPVKVYGPPGTENMSRAAIRHMHEVDYRFVRTILENWPPHLVRRPRQEPPFDVRDVGPGTLLETDRFTVKAVETKHFPDPQTKSLGFRVDSQYGSIAISGDTAVSDGMKELARNVDILVHECVKPDPGMTPGGKFSLQDFHDAELMQERPQTGHTSPTQLGLLASEANAKKLVAYHLAPYTSVPAAVEMSDLYLGPSPGPEIWPEFARAIKDHYDGPVVLAEDRMVFAVGA